MRRFLIDRGLFAGAAVSAMAALTLIAGCTVVQDDEEGLFIQTAPAELRGMRVTAESNGELEPVLKVEVKSKASGEILELFGDSGDEVEQGALLAEVDPRDVDNAYEQAAADLDVAKARNEIAVAQLARSQQLLDSMVITQREFEQSKLESANALAGLVRARTNLDLAVLRRADVKIRAPMAGTILEKLVEFGQVIQSATQNVSGGTTLFVMANLDNMRVRTFVDETDVGQLAAGMSATVSVEAFPDRTFQGVIEKIEPQALVQQNVTMFPVIVLLDNRAGLLKPGMNAEVEVLIDERTNTLTVPNNAVVQPQQLAPAAEVLGMDPGTVSIDRAVWGPLMAEAQQKLNTLMPNAPTMTAAAGGAGRFGAMRGGQEAAPDGATPDEDASGGGATDGMNGATDGTAGDAGMGMAEIRRLMENGEISRDSAMALFGAMSGRGGQQMGGGRQMGDGAAGGNTPQGGPGGQGGQGGAGRGQGGMGGFGGMGAFGMAMGGASGDPAFKPAVAFVMNAAGNLEARAIILGISDWDYAEVLAGLKEGEELALIGAAQLQARQQERMERMSQRMGGGRPF